MRSVRRRKHAHYSYPLHTSVVMPIIPLIYWMRSYTSQWKKNMRGDILGGVTVGALVSVFCPSIPDYLTRISLAILAQRVAG